MNISFTPANYRPNFQASFDRNHFMTQDSILEIAEKDPENILATHFLLKDAPEGDKFILNCEFNTLGTTTSYKIRDYNTGRRLDFGNERQCERDLFRAFSRHYEGIIDEPWYSSENKYRLQAKEALNAYKERFYSEESIELEKDINTIDEQIEQLEKERYEKELRKVELDKESKAQMAEAIAQDILDVNI